MMGYFHRDYVAYRSKMEVLYCVVSNITLTLGLIICLLFKPVNSMVVFLF
jgi:hypothetical protein